MPLMTTWDKFVVEKVTRESSQNIATLKKRQIKYFMIV